MLTPTSRSRQTQTLRPCSDLHSTPPHSEFTDTCLPSFTFDNQQVNTHFDSLQLGMSSEDASWSKGKVALVCLPTTVAVVFLAFFLAVTVTPQALPN